MIENPGAKQKGENLKTECCLNGKMVQLQFGKPVKLPYIRKAPNNNQHSNFSRRSFEGKELKIIRNSTKEMEQSDLSLLDQTRLMNQTRLLEQTRVMKQTQMLTLQEIELCNQKVQIKDSFPKINAPQHPMVRREWSIQSLEHLGRIKSEKNIAKVENWESLKDYKIGSVIGRGSYAVVRMCRNCQGKKFAIKTYARSSLHNNDKKVNLQREIDILSRLNHPSIVQFIQAIHTQDCVHIITELLQNISLADYLKNQNIKKLDESKAANLMKQLVRVFQYLHSQNIVHRDVKMENILLSSDFKIKVIDFGFSLHCAKENTLLDDFCGTPRYIAPEVILKEGYLGKPADVWSLGVLLYRITVGTFPFKGINEKALFSKILKCDLRLPGQLSQSLQTMLSRMLNSDARRRPTIEELSHYEWLM